MFLIRLTDFKWTRAVESVLCLSISHLKHMTRLMITVVELAIIFHPFKE